MRLPSDEPTTEKYIVTLEMTVYISNDMKHDLEFVKHCTQDWFDQIKHRFNVTIITQFSDGCSSQYKSKKPFLDISSTKEDLEQNAHFERHYFGSGHGNGPADGTSAVVKAAVSRAIKSGRFLIEDAHGFYVWCDQNLSKNGERFICQFCYIAADEIHRDDEHLHLKPVTGTRKLHAMKAVGSGVLKNFFFLFLHSLFGTWWHWNCL